MTASYVSVIGVRMDIWILVFKKCALVFCFHGGVGYPRTGVTDSYKLPYGCCKLNLDPLEEKSMLLITAPKQYLQHHGHIGS